MKKLVTLAAVSSLAFAGGYKVPEQSINSTALSAAYIANAHGADAAYYNPANMIFSKDGSQFEASLTYIGLDKINYSPDTGTDTQSMHENFYVPTFHYISPKQGRLRYGLAMTVPAGLSKRWENDPAKKTAEEFTLSTYEINPSVAFEVSEHLAVALGFRAIYSDGKVKSYATSGANVISRDLVGDHWDYGYNFALSFQPEEYMRFALTYRSKIVLEPEGNAKLTHAFGTKYNGWAKVAVPVPSALNVATAFDLNKDTTLELTYERTYWSEYTDLDFSYSSQLTDVIPGTGLYTSFDKPQARNWKNTNTYRIGLTHQQDEKSTVMLGFAYDNNPVPEETLGYELPDSDAIILSFGMKYKASEKLTYGFAFLYDKKESRQVNQTTGSNPINGEFSGSKAYLLTMGAQYSF